MPLDAASEDVAGDEVGGAADAVRDSGLDDKVAGDVCITFAAGTVAHAASNDAIAGMTSKVLDRPTAMSCLVRLSATP